MLFCCAVGLKHGNDTGNSLIHICMLSLLAWLVHSCPQCLVCTCASRQYSERHEFGFLGILHSLHGTVRGELTGHLELRWKVHSELCTQKLPLHWLPLWRWCQSEECFLY